jgi:nicotinate-nucleotide pyrophosphorylase (carboxylating)
VNTLELIELAFKEDLPSGDLTTDSLAVKNYPGSAKVIAKSDLILSGQDLFEKSIQHLDPHAQIKWLFQDGQIVLSKQTICTIKGNLVNIVKAERVALNFLGKFSGIATLTRRFVNEVRNTQTKILDTRKTTPLYRNLEKKAVVDGGGKNHRKNLSDEVMIKENHIRIAQSLDKAIDQIRSQTKKFMTVEAHTLEDVEICVQKNVNRILLDNMEIETLEAALEKIPSHIETEASGNMTLERVSKVAATGVNYISVGALTHSAPVADISMIFDWK